MSRPSFTTARPAHVIPGYCPACRSWDLDVPAGRACPECGTELRDCSGRFVLLDRAAATLTDWLVELLTFVRLGAERSWGIELVTVLFAVSLATTASRSSVTSPSLFWLVLGALAGGSIIGLVLAAGAGFYGATAAILTALLFHDPLSSGTDVLRTVLVGGIWVVSAAVTSRLVSGVVRC